MRITFNSFCLPFGKWEVRFYNLISICSRLGGKLTTCRLITVKEGFGEYWDNLMGIVNTIQEMTENDIDEELIENKSTKVLVKQLLSKAFYIQIKNVKKTDQELTFDADFDNIRMRKFKNQIFPEATHHEIYARIPLKGDNKIGFLFGQSIDTAFGRSRLSRYLAKRGAYTDVPISSIAVNHMLRNDSMGIEGISLKDVRKNFKVQYEGFEVDKGMSDSIARDKGQGGKDDAVAFLSRELNLKVKISLTHSTISASIPQGEEEAIIDYVFKKVVPYL